MFPFPNNNGYPFSPYLYNVNYETFQSPQIENSAYIYPFMNHNFTMNHENTIPNPFPSQQMPYFYQRSPSFLKEQDPEHQKKKRTTAKLTLTDVKKRIRASNSQYKSNRASFKYFDPSRAPPITSLRNKQQMDLDMRLQQQRHTFYNLGEDDSNQKVQENQLKLQILLEQPDSLNYPFLICKKRKYHRSLKRRYSVAYFEQRSAYIMNKQPIPPSLHPKNKVRKPRVPKHNVSEVSDSSENFISSEYSQNSEESHQRMKKSQKDGQVFRKAENTGKMKINQIKQENESSPVSEAEC